MLSAGKMKTLKVVRQGGKDARGENVGPRKVARRAVIIDSESSGTEVDEDVKRRKVASQEVKSANRGFISTGAVSEAGLESSSMSECSAESVVINTRAGRQKRKLGPVAVTAAAVEVVNDPVIDMKAVTEGVTVTLVDGAVSTSVLKDVLAHANKYEVILMRLVEENARLRGRLEAVSGAGGSLVAARTPLVPPLAPVVGRGASVVPRTISQAISAAASTAVPAATTAVAVPSMVFPSLPVPKPVETWSVVVKGKKGVSAKQMVDKVVKEAGPALGVRIHEVRPRRDGGAIIRTPSLAERLKLVNNKKFSEMGLDVTVAEKLGPKIVVQKVHSQITPDEFMGELYALNLKDEMDMEAFIKSVRLTSGPWKADGGPVNVVLECTPSVAEHLRRTGVYIKWFRFSVRVLDVISTCHRCLGFDHVVRNCRTKVGTCRRCGAAGHMAPRCPNEIRCRDCTFRGFPAGHRMLTAECPIYARMVDRVNSRH